MSPKTGRFLSRDPIEYMDGVNLYRVNIILASLDPEGLAELDADPTSSDGVKWCYKDFPRLPGTFVHGDTENWHEYRVVCRCVCCSDGFCNGTKKKMPMCTVIVRLSIRINPKSPWKKEDIYGHEQHHVENLITEAKRAQSMLTARERAAGCKGENECAKLAAAMEEDAHGILTQALEDEKNHTRPRPQKGTKYQPIFPMPKDPQPKCELPSDPKPFVEPPCVYIKS